MTEIIAEAGINWDSMEDAKEMIWQSKLAGASFCKFQLYNEEVIKGIPSSLYNELKKRMLTKQDAKELFDYGKEIGQPVFFSCMFEESVDWVVEIGVPMIKIRFADRENYPLIKRILETDKRVVMSIDRSYQIPSLVLRELTSLVLREKSPIDLLWCVPKYPAVPEDYTFTRIDFKLFSGVSDHTKGLEVAKRALCCAAKIIIEKHTMLSKTHPIEERWCTTFKKLQELVAYAKTEQVSRIE